MIILYPGYSFETLSSDRTAQEAKELIAAFSAAFHPALIETFDEIPRWESASVPPYEVSAQPILIPPCCESYLNEEWFGQQEEGGAVLVRHLAEREEIQAELLRRRDLEDHGFDDEFVADFCALGTTYFLTDLLVRQLHYMSMMDDSQLISQVFNAIRSYRDGSHETARDHLKQAFEAVCQSKEYFYPIQSYFLDLTLLTRTTIGLPLRQLLRERDQVNLFLPAELLRKMPEWEPESFEALKSACESERVRFIVDDTERRSLLLLPILDVADRILDGISTYRELLNVSPTVYGRLHCGLTPVLPQLLQLAAMKGAVHFAPLDGWHLKEEVQSKMIWQGIDGTKFDALVRYPLNGSSDLDFFALADQLGETINNDQAPTAVFAQFPMPRDPSGASWLDDLRRMGRFASELGTFTPIDRYFDDTAKCGGVKTPGFGKYPGNALSEAVAENRSDPISHWNDVYRRSVDRLIRSAFETILSLLGKDPTDRPIGEQFVETILGRKPSGMPKGIILTNPWSFPRRAFVDVSDWDALPDETSPVVLAEEQNGRKEIVVDIPPLGYAFVEPKSVSESSGSHDSRSNKEKKPKKILGFLRKGDVATENTLIRSMEEPVERKRTRSVFLLKNEYFEAKIDAVTGMLRSIFTSSSRFNRLSQQLGFRLPKEERAADTRSAREPNRGYAIMAADDISIDCNGPVTGRLGIRGRLVCQDGTVAAAFEETVTIRRRSRILRVDLSLEPRREPGDSPWDSYYAIRSAWNDNTLDLRGCLADGTHPLAADRLQSPRFVDLRGEKLSLTLLTEGLPFHRRFGERQLDTILIAGGETARSFRFGIGVDLRFPACASLEFLAPKDDLLAAATERPRNPVAWLFQIEAKNVTALHWEAVVEEGRGVGFRVFLLETEGRRAHFALHSFRPVEQAAATDLFGGELKEFKTDDDHVLIDMHGHELLPLSVRFR